jgi:hypothetical protein
MVFSIFWYFRWYFKLKLSSANLLRYFSCERKVIKNKKNFLDIIEGKNGKESMNRINIKDLNGFYFTITCKLI